MSSEIPVKQVDQMVNEFTQLGKNHDALEKLRDAMITLHNGLDNINERVFDLVNQREQLTTEIDGQRQAITDLRNQDDTCLNMKADWF